MLKAPKKTENKAKTALDIAYSLSDQIVINQMSFDQYLELAAQNEQIALSIVQNPKILAVVDGLALSVLGSKHPKVALEIANNPVCKEKLLGIDLEKLAAASEYVALQIIKMPEFKKKLKSYHIAHIASMYPEALTEILNDKELFDKIEYIHYGLLTKNDPVAASKLIKDKLTYMEGVEIALIVKHHPELALETVFNKLIRPKLDTESLVIIGAQNPAIAEKIVDDPSYFEQLGPIGVSRIIAHHEDLAHLTLSKHPDLVTEFDKISVSCLVEHHSSIADSLYDNSQYRDKMRFEKPHQNWLLHNLGLLETDQDLIELKEPNPSLLKTFEKVCITFLLKNQIALPTHLQKDVLKNLIAPLLLNMEIHQRKELVQQLVAELRRIELDELVVLGHHSENIAKELIHDYFDKLTGQDLIYLGAKNQEVANLILNNSNLCQRLSGQNIVLMCQNHPQLCEKVFQTEVLRDKVVGCHVGTLTLRDPSLVQQVMGDSKFRDNLTQKDLPLMCKRYLGVTKDALKDPELCKMFSVFYKELLLTRINTVESIASHIKKKFDLTSEDTTLDALSTSQVKLDLFNYKTAQASSSQNTSPTLFMDNENMSPNSKLR